MKTSIILVFVTLIFTFACNEKKKNAVEELKEKVFAVHDEIMPKMGDIMRYKKQLNKRIDDLNDAGADENAEKITELKKVVEELDSSQEGMMNWMHEFNSNFDDMVEDQILKYLNDQMTKIENVAKATNKALNDAEEILSK